MKKTEIIDFAILETLKAHPDFDKSISFTLFSNIVNQEGIIPKNFTSQNGARKMMREVSQRDILEFILKRVVQNYNAMSYFYFHNEESRKRATTEEKVSYLLGSFPNYHVIQNAICIIANPKVNSFIYYTSRPKDLLAIVNAVMENEYLRAPVYHDYITKCGTGKTYLLEYGEQNLFNKVTEDRQKSEVAVNLQVNRRIVNKCLSEVLSGAQLKNQRNEYGLDGTLFATQDIGRRRKNQEDSVLILTHPENPSFKLLTVSDGMGGAELGEVASQYTVQELAKWFNSISPDLYYYPMELQKILNNKIAQISQNIYKTYNEPYNEIRTGTTLATAIVTENTTVISYVGDSRVYSIDKGRLRLLSRDQSRVWPIGKKPNEVSTKELDDLRFNRYNNEILRCIGDDIEARQIQTLTTPNNSYDRLLLFSDGVTDLLSQERIRIISSQAPKELVTKMLVDEAISIDAIRAQGSDEFHKERIPAGKDNATAAMYARR